jgi:glucose 1-dehydrogenase
MLVMQAITVEPHRADSASLEEVADPDVTMGSILCEAVAVGVCGTDIEITSGAYGWAPPGRERLVLGHESLGRVVDPGPGSGLAKGDLVVGIVRRPDPVPCPSCAVGEWDMCRNGQYTERGIKAVDGYMSERWRIEPEYAVRVAPELGTLGVLLEPTTVVAKAWEVAMAAGMRAFWEPTSVLITGAGPIGLLAALLGVQRGLDVHVLDRATSGPKPELVRALGATYHTGAVCDIDVEPDVVIEATGVRELIVEAIDQLASGGVVCLTGISGGTDRLEQVAPATLTDEIVLQNKVIVGSVNANRRHYYKAAGALARADLDWLGRLVTRRVPADHFADALARQPDDIKAVIEFA